MLNDIAIKILLGISSLLGVKDVPDTGKQNWVIQNSWTVQEDRNYFKASSVAAVESCQQNPNSYLSFPSVVHGTHKITLDGNRVISFGDPSFKSVRSFYGSPYVECSEVKNSKHITWEIFSYSKYFSRFSEFPKIVDHIPHDNIFAETLNAVAAGTLFLMSIIVGVVFWNKNVNSISLSLAFANFFFSFYFFGAVAGFFGFSFSMFTTHKIADTSMWFGMTAFFYSLKFSGVLSKKLFNIFLGHVIPAVLLILIGSTGDIIQLGTTLPFGMTMFISLVCGIKQGVNFLKNRTDTRALFYFLCLGFCVSVFVNDVLVITGFAKGYMFLNIGLVGGLAFFALSVNAKVNEAYQQLSYLTGNLEHEVKQKTIELTQKNQDLATTLEQLKTAQAELVQSAKLASLGTLSAGIAHEINNALNYVYGSLKPVEKAIDDIPDAAKKDKIKKLIAIMNDGLKLTFEIIKNLKDFSGMNRSSSDHLNVYLVIKSVLALLKSKFNENIKVDINIPKELEMHGSVVGLNQVFMNLITNAIDAMPNGGKLSFVTKELADKIILEVSDTGCGIPQEIKDRIFDPFFSTKEVGKGTGLGLHIVRKEVEERHRGKISVKSEAGKGTTFILEFPKLKGDEKLAA